MQHLTRMLRVDYLPSSYSSEQLLGDREHYLPTFSWRGNLSSEYDGYSSDGSPACINVTRNLPIYRQQLNCQKVNNGEPLAGVAHKYPRYLKTDSQRCQFSDDTESQHFFHDAIYSPIVLDSRACSSFENAASNQISPRNFFTENPNETLFGEPTQMGHFRAGQDEVLEENLASVAKYVEELTDGGSGPTSRSSSLIRRPPDSYEPNPECADNGGTVEAEVQDANSISPTKKPATWTSNTSNRWLGQTFQKPSIYLEPVFDNKRNENLQQSQQSLQRTSSVESQDQEISTTSFTSQETALINALVNQLNLRNSEGNDEIANIDTNLLRSLLLFVHNQLLELRVSRRTSHAEHLFPSTIRTQHHYSNSEKINSPNTTTGINHFTNQTLNLQDTLTFLSPNSLYMLIGGLDNGQIDARQVLSILLTSASHQTSPGGPNNSGLLATVLGLLHSMDARNNSRLTSILIATFKVLAQRKDTIEGTQKKVSHNLPMTSASPLTNSSGRKNACSLIVKNDSPLRTICLQRRTNSPPSEYRLSNAVGDIDRAATMYRNSASNASQKLQILRHCVGKLPMRNYTSMSFSRKVFLGGVPWESTSDDLICTFSPFGNVSVLWPQKDGGCTSNYGLEGGCDRSTSVAPKGYCYLLFEHDSCVAELLKMCSRDPISGGDYFKLSSPKFKAKYVQVIPWVISDSQYNCGGDSTKAGSRNTVFVGALHGMITAEALASLMNQLFGNVVFAALDTDKHKYPIGSGRVVFSNPESYMRAVIANFVEVHTPKFTKTLQIDPFLEDSMCNSCVNSAGVYFCRAFECFRYFCPTCWQKWHNMTQVLFNHKPLRRSLKLCTERA